MADPRGHNRAIDAVTLGEMRINHAGNLLWDRHKYYVSWSLQLQLVGLEPVSDGNWLLYFGPRALAVVDATTKKLRPIPADGATNSEKEGKPKKRGQSTTGMGVGPITYPLDGRQRTREGERP